MILPRHMIPHRGDIYVSSVDEEQPLPEQPWHVRLLRLRPRTSKRTTLYFRQIVDVTPTVVFYNEPNREERVVSAWISDWIDWAEYATRLRHKGELIAAEKIYAITGTGLPLPFDIGLHLELGCAPEDVKAGGTD